MSALLKKLLGGVYMAPADDGAATGGAVDRGDELPAAGSEEEQIAADAAAAAATKEEEGQAAADAAAAAAAAEEEAAKPAPKPKMIPKERFDEQRMKAKERETALMDRIKALEAGVVRDVQAQDVTKLDGEIKELETKYQQALDDGDKTLAIETMRSIRLKERQISEASVEHKTDRARALAVEEFKVDMLIERMEQDFPVLNPSDEAYDQEVVDEVVLLRSGFEKSGMSSSAALTKAIKYVMATVVKAEPGAEDEAPKDEKAKGLGGAKAAERRAEQLKKNLEAADKQPAKLTDVGLDSHKKGGGESTAKPSEMTPEEYSALPESTRAKLRGDFA